MMELDCFDPCRATGRPDRLAPARRLAITGALIAFISAVSGATHAQKTTPSGTAVAPPSGPIGVWYDDTGQGAVEILQCGERLCGRIFWLKDPVAKNGQPLTDALNPDPRQRQRPVCGLQVIGDLKLQQNGAWDTGWIYDPKEGKSYDVEIMLRGPDRLQVKGYMGVKFLSETFVWQRAPADLPRCST